MLYTCPICGLEVDRPKKLELHLNAHQGIRPYQCDICSQAFARPSTLRVHKSTVHSEQPGGFVCGDCGMCFRTKDKLNRHSQVHRQGIRCFFCEDDIRHPWLHLHMLATHQDKMNEILKEFGLPAMKTLKDDYLPLEEQVHLPRIPLAQERLLHDLPFVHNCNYTPDQVYRMLAGRLMPEIKTMVDTFFHRANKTHHRLRYLDLFQIFRVCPRCGRSGDALGRYLNHCIVCDPSLVELAILSRPLDVQAVKKKQALIKRQIRGSGTNNEVDFVQKQPIVCQMCGRLYTSVKTLKLHLRRQHGMVGKK
ncbi:Zinc finger domain-containing protein [Giardia muris]|uniref:Zinc finger domain-containing protein n=1 Tax=Giardia muris TaxID=5742 RepID=A0A4Z1SPB5_GIAMU|nr:Zinc finger domain-containing protein [Giardia muris]|eukprot:TNJ26705.1 Zinc finger domain-containing protein [Giardia muris]